MTEIMVNFFFNDTATTEIYTLSLHDALPILCIEVRIGRREHRTLLDVLKAENIRWIERRAQEVVLELFSRRARKRSEEHTSELQSQSNLVCRLLLENKKN